MQRVFSLRSSDAGSTGTAQAVPRLRTLLLAMSVGAALIAPRPALALGLVDAYEAALGHDPILAGAAKQKEADDANVGIGRSYLLPNVSANYARYRDITDTKNMGTSYGDYSTHQVYGAYSQGVSLRQPLISFEGIARYRYGKATALAGDATFDDSRQDLLVRVLTAYTDTVFAEDQLSLALAQKNAFDEQYAGNQAMFKNGEGTRTDILETKSKAALAEADVADARDSLDNAAHALEALTGLPASLDVAGLDRLKDDFQPVLPEPLSFDHWHDVALENNAQLIAGRHSVEAAQQKMKIVQAGFYPRVDLVASVGQNQSTQTNAIGARYLTKSVGVEVTIPLYSGGLVRASTQQEQANYERAQFELQDKTDKVLLDLRKQYNQCVSSMTRIDSLKSAVESAMLQIVATRKSVQAGVRTNADVLTATQQLYTAKRDLAHARYQFLLAELQLKHAAGILTEQDLVEIAQSFVPPGQAAPLANAVVPTARIH
ncbi:type I secretion outer membrane protein, TolC family [Paraburkholderia atlantica]|uniref:Type I secretion outer membrane protein, TolC family n=1 Tax=Paraburkholderia atlantica TaxID=2654982 RepID=D5WG39_PARAM|nr:TolC family outer membrane protein [Paraburkholderia atlantica]ADG19415.1 type I secretion outer membrane protein, TolC family [Paraburkholderia atlantica]